MSVLIHEMTIQDHKEVLDLWQASDGVGLSDSDSRESIARFLDHNPGLSFVARDSRQLVGVVLCGHDGRRGYIHHLAVSKSHRRRGVGRALADWCLSALRADGIHKCHIFVFDENQKAIAFWKKIGWMQRVDLTVMSQYTVNSRQHITAPDRQVATAGYLDAKEGTEKMSQRKRVVLTGAAGLIAGLLLPALRERYDLTLLDVRTTDRYGNEVQGIQIADLLNRNRDAYRHYFRRVDAVVHCGFRQADNPDDPTQRFFAELANVEMAHNVYQTAWEEKVRRVVVASSNHAADYYEPLILGNKWDIVSPDMRALSDNYYGWAKEAYEHLGFVFAAGKPNGRPLGNVQIRIGGPRETDVANCAKGDLTCMRRALAAYISQRDLSQLFIKSIEAEDIRDEQGVPFQIFYGVSDNPHAFWSIVNARKVIGYEPQDNSEIRFRELINEHIRAAQQQSEP